MAAAIIRFASLMAGYLLDTMGDPDYRAIVDKDLLTGVHQNPTEKDYFTDAYFHVVDELEEEVKTAGFRLEKTVAVEGFIRVQH